MMGEQESQHKIGYMEAEINQLKDDVAEIKADLKVVVATMEQAKGGWRAIALVAGIAGVLGAVLTKFTYFLMGLPLPK